MSVTLDLISGIESLGRPEQLAFGESVLLVEPKQSA
jgi:hypothetical protein